ncbi:MAG: DEAD/DEAH box helicase [Bacteroidia bacterium]|nr:DEAD/DEAH box helicase [Bacteroidia bacterium]
MRLVDPALPFRVVYSTYHHEYLGYLISSHYVQLLPNRSLSLVHQHAYPENMAQFADGMDDTDRELIKLAGDITPREIVKRFGGNPRKDFEFFNKKFNGEIEKLAASFIQRKMAQILPLLIGKLVFSMGNDSYPAHTPLEVLPEKATVLFHFRRHEDFTVYFPTIKLRGTKIDFQFKNAILLALEPAWMLLNGEVFSFEQDVEGAKLRPFLKKRNISIPKEKEDVYYKKFISQIVEKYDISAKGFHIQDIKKNPVFSIQVKENNGDSFSFIREVNYGEFSIPLEDEHKVKAQMVKNDPDITFFRIIRDQEKESSVRQLLDEIQPNPNSLTPWQYVEKESGLGWLSKYRDLLVEHDIDIVQKDQHYHLNLNRPEIELTTTEEGDWFDIKAVVRIGKFVIPFIKFRTHILKNQREYVLPDGSIAILPEEWFSDYRHLMEVSKEKEDGSLGIKKYQAPLLNFPSKNKKGSDWLESIKNLETIPQIMPPDGLNATLRNYQQEGFNWLYFLKNHGMAGILADDMGLGKTVQTLSFLLKEKEEGNETASLVVLPTSLVHNWCNEARKFTPALKVLVHTGVGRRKDLDYFAKFDLILTTYGIVRQDIKELKAFPFHYVILDESQMIKNPESKTAKAIRKLVSKHRLSLTGTPIENTVMDIWSQMAFLNPGLLGNEAFFKRFYVTPIEKNKDANRSAKLRRIISPFILRRKKNQVEKDLPPKIEKLQYCEMQEGQEKFYEDIKNTYRNYLMELITQNAWKKNKLNILTGLQKLRQIAIHPKMVEPEKFELKDSGKYKELKRLLKQVIESDGSKVLIFSQFVKMLQLLKNDLDEEGIRYNYLDGMTKDRQNQVDTFQKDKGIKVFLISLKAGGVGLNLTAADYVFILDPWWNPAVENQAIDRSHRIGQKKTVFYYKFITKDSIEEKILSLQRKKAKLSDDIISVEDDIYKSLDVTDLEELLA